MALLLTGCVLLGTSVAAAGDGTSRTEPPLGRTVEEIRDATATGTTTSDPTVPTAEVRSARRPQGPAPRPTAASLPDPPVTASHEEAPVAEERGEVARPESLTVPGVGIETPLIHLGLNAERRLEVPEDPSLAGWWSGGPVPGEDGAAVIVGHVDSKTGPGVFWHLSRLAPGDEVVVRSADGGVVTFVVDGVGRWPKDEFPTDDVYHRHDGPELRLITCGGELDPRTGHHKDNVVVFATLR